MPARQRIRAGFSYSDRIAPLLDGSVSDAGLDLEIRLDAAASIFRQAREEGGFDVAEMSLATHCMAVARRERDFVGLPIFTSRMFRHHAIYVHGDRIRSPRQLAGKRIGLVNYASTTAVWLRGILAEHHGLDPREVTWCVGGADGGPAAGPASAGTREAAVVPADVKHIPVASEVGLLDLLQRGDVDAVISPGLAPQAHRAVRELRSLFDPAQAAERAYFRATGIFPIMHLCVLRSAVHARLPDLAPRLFRLFEDARRVAQARLDHTDLAPVMLPWCQYARDPDFNALPGHGWAHGVESNRQCLSTFLRYLREQGLLSAPLDQEEIFIKDIPGGWSQ
ncbi:hypothetical protein [Castellaniella sp.]|uniref:hypothetical protein n=1 Tax=Castellaniella sp. TaxID=1955812 RepID=UPI003C72CF5D